MAWGREEEAGLHYIHTHTCCFFNTDTLIPWVSAFQVMEIGTELSKTVATFIMQKILLDDVRKARGREAGVRGASGREGCEGSVTRCAAAGVGCTCGMCR